ncbi:MAG: hypothetical protein KJ630_13760 [Proteobacteria bacterium]|nr:hypothetical protein [Pseudomonadota bacterium]
MDNYKKIFRERCLYFSLGVLSLAVISFLMGAATDYQGNNTTLNFGRYAISSWATQLDNKSAVVGAFVLDTVSGETRTVYYRTYGDVPKSKASKNDLKKPFNAIQ